MEEIEADIFERRTPDNRVLGFAVMNFSKHNLSALSLPFEVQVLPAV